MCIVPKPMTYKANSVIYFQGDVSDRIYILKSGRVSLTSNDIETGQEIHDYIQTGEFFGVKSALGRYPREESAAVLSDAHVIMFTVPEFEQVVSANTRIIMKMLKVFSNQLRKMHAKVQDLLASDSQNDPEEGLFRIGEYYLRKKQYSKALYAFQRYLTYYPSGKFHVKANSHALTAENYAQQYGVGKGPGVPGLTTGDAPQSTTQSKPEEGRSLSDVAKRFYDAVSLFSRQEYTDSLKAFKQIAASGGDEEYTVKSLFEIGRCLHALKQYGPCIKHFTGMIQKYPKMPSLPDALYYVGQSYLEQGDATRASGFFNKIISMPGIDDGLKRKVNKAMKAVEET